MKSKNESSRVRSEPTTETVSEHRLVRGTGPNSVNFLLGVANGELCLGFARSRWR